MTRRAAAAALLAGASLAGCGGSTPTLPSNQVAQALAGRLAAEQLSVHWVACIASGQRYAGARVFRCNVSFGDPHVIPYCATLIDGALATDRERASMRCYRHADKGRYRKAAFP